MSAIVTTTNPLRTSAGVRGFSLLEAMVAIIILGVALLGALTGFIASQRQLHDGSTRQFREQLLDASAQRWMLGSKSALAATASPLATACASGPCTGMAVGAAPWSPDPTQTTGFVTGDLSTGAYFKIATDGTITQLPGAFTNCNDASLPADTYCRELAVTTSPAPVVNAGASWTQTWPPAAPAGLPAGATVTTLWIRVLKKGEPVSKAVSFTSSFVQ